MSYRKIDRTLSPARQRSSIPLTKDTASSMPSFILEDPFKRYTKVKTILHTSLRAKIVVERNGRHYVLVMAPLEIDGVANGIERVVQNILRLSHPNLVTVSLLLFTNSFYTFVLAFDCPGIACFFRWLLH